MMASSLKDGSAYLELKFSPSIELISLVRRFVFDFHRQLLKDDDTVSRVALATHELLENAVRYSTNGEARVQIRVTTDPDDHVSIFTIRMENSTEASHLKALEVIFAELKAATDPFEHYRKVMMRNAKRTDGSGLGLARIRAEAEMDLDYEVNDDKVCIVARTTVQLQGDV